MYTETERAQHLTHGDRRVFGQSYVANTSSVDGKGAFLGEKRKDENDHVDFFQSYSLYHEKGLPTEIPAARQATVLKDESLALLKSQVASMKKEGASTKDLSKARRKVTCHLSKLLKKALKEYQSEWVGEQRDKKVTSLGQYESDDGVSSNLSGTISLMFPERKRLGEAMVSMEPVSDEVRRRNMEDLYLLISRDCSVVYRPGEEPNGGLCPVVGCSTDLSR